MPLNFELLKGTSRDLSLSATTPEGGAIADDLTTAATPTAVVWPGGDRPATFSPSAAWISAADRTFRVSIADADTALVDPAIYYLQAWTVVGGRTLSLLPNGSTFEVLPSPGATAARPSYVTMDDLRAVAVWIDDLQVPDSLAGFERQLADARDWLDEILTRAYRGTGAEVLGWHGAALAAWNGPGTGGVASRWIKDQLTANRLIVSPRLKMACAYYALSRICEAMLTRTGGQYRGLGASCRQEAESLLVASTAEIDTDGDGYGDVAINLSSTW